MQIKHQKVVVRFSQAEQRMIDKVRDMMIDLSEVDKDANEIATRLQSLSDRHRKTTKKTKTDAEATE